MSKKTEVTVASSSELQEGERIFVQVRGSEIAIFNIDGEFYAINNYCPHMEGPLGQGKTNEDGSTSIQCPWHGWEFDLESGEACFPTRKRVSTYDVWEEAGEIKLSL